MALSRYDLSNLFQYTTRDNFLNQTFENFMTVLRLEVSILIFFRLSVLYAKTPELEPDCKNIK